MHIKEKTYKKNWFRINEVIEILNRVTETQDFSAKTIFQNACLSGYNKRYPSMLFPSKNNIKIYFHSDKIEARVLNFDDFDKCIGNIVLSGNIPLKKKYIEELLDRNKTIIKSFDLSVHQDIKNKRLRELCTKDVDFSWALADTCEIYENQCPQITNSNINELFIYQTDLSRLVKKYKILNKKQTKFLPAKAPETNKAKNENRKRMISHYKEAAINCLAHIIWDKYPNILKVKFAEYAPFIDIHSYRNKRGLRKDKDGYKTINKWIGVSMPAKIKLKSRPQDIQKEPSDEQFKEMKNIIEPFIPSILQILQDSIDYYTARPSQRKDMEDEGSIKKSINLDIIVDEIRKKNSKIKDRDFWSNFLIKNKFSLDIMAEEQSKGQINSETQLPLPTTQYSV